MVLIKTKSVQIKGFGNILIFSSNRKMGCNRIILKKTGAIALHPTNDLCRI